MNNTKYSKKILLRLTNKQYDLLKKIKNETGIPISELIRKAIEIFIEIHFSED